VDAVARRRTSGLGTRPGRKVPLAVSAQLAGAVLPPSRQLRDVGSRASRPPGLASSTGSSSHRPGRAGGPLADRSGSPPADRDDLGLERGVGAVDPIGSVGGHLRIIQRDTPSRTRHAAAHSLSDRRGPWPGPAGRGRGRRGLRCSAAGSPGSAHAGRIRVQQDPSRVVAGAAWAARRYGTEVPQRCRLPMLRTDADSPRQLRRHPRDHRAAGSSGPRGGRKPRGGPVRACCWPVSGVAQRTSPHRANEHWSNPWMKSFSCHGAAAASAAGGSRGGVRSGHMSGASTLAAHFAGG
jgi:hypothetical protein